MDERPFFPVSQQSAAEPAAKPKLKRRQSLGSGPPKAPPDAGEGTQHAGREGTEPTRDEKAEAETNADAADVAPPSTPPPKVNKALNGARRKRRAHSMEPMTSDAILKMLGTTEPAPEAVGLSTPKQPIRTKTVSSSAKRRKTLNGPPTQRDEDEVTASQASGIVAESESENEQDDELQAQRNEVIVIMDSQASQPSPAPLERKQKSPGMSTDLSSTPITSSAEFSIGSRDDNSAKKEPTARELRRRNRNSLSYGSGLTLKTGIWSCTACGCSNPRTRRYCTDCRTARGSAKSPGADSVATASPATVASTVVNSPKTPATPAVDTPTNATPGTQSTPVPATPGIPSTPASATPKTQTTPGPATPPSKRKPRAPNSVTNAKTPSSSPSVLERTPRSLTRPTASSAAKIRTPSPAVSRVTRASASAASSPVSRSRTQSPAARSSASGLVTRTSLASASALTDVSLKKPTVSKAARKLPTSVAPSSTVKQGVSKKRARPPVSINAITTPVVKKTRRDTNKENAVEAKHMATPGSVSGFVRKCRDVDSTPIPMAMSFSSTTSRRTPCKTPRNVIGITGVSPEARGVLQCAIHAIDANMANADGHRKARVVKSVDYAAGVTHLIVGKDARRTIKVLFAIARGAWIVTEDWAFSSLEQERWLPEENFEITMFANKYSREHPQSRQIFKGIKFFVGSNVEPSREVLQSLIQVSGGEVSLSIYGLQ
ncbi:unnamed protein product [Phytophthora fragariaefolia]|uniref:Unnamed protein product n=1 Tax=Phytophthora fragariaefolia TaxID=1490495 RepID=A0A9W7D6G6_9STRA|nr:unnamed protein product [Phytophthora fragariaefolia]